MRVRARYHISESTRRNKPADEVKATQDQDQEPKKCASALHVSCDADAETMNPMRPLEDPGGATDGDERRPDGPTETPEGARWRAEGRGEDIEAVIGDSWSSLL